MNNNWSSPFKVTEILKVKFTVGAKGKAFAVREYKKFWIVRESLSIDGNPWDEILIFIVPLDKILKLSRVISPAEVLPDKIPIITKGERSDILIA